MDGSGSQSNSLFNSFVSAEQLGRRFSDQKSASSQTPSVYGGDTWDASRAMGFSSPSLANPSMQPALNVGFQQQQQQPQQQQPPQKEISLSLLQALLKPQPAASQPFPSSHPSMQVSDSESATGQQPEPGFFQQPAAAAAAAVNPIEQLKRMMAAQNAMGGSQPPLPPQQIASTSQMPLASQIPPISQAALGASAASQPLAAAAAPATSQAKVLSAHSSPRLSAAKSVPSSPPLTFQAAQSGSSTKTSTPTKKRTKALGPSYDLRRVKLKAKPETIPISLLQQPLRFRPGRLVAVSREYICYAVRSKEGGHIRVIHQLQGQLAKMQGHRDSIVDMEFHPASRDSEMPQILASLGKDNRLIIWLVGPTDMDAATAEGAIAYEPFINIDSGGDARFTCLAWRAQIVDGAMELCVGTDKGFMAVKAPVPSPKGKRAEASNEGLNVIPIATDSAVTAITRAGLRWVIVASADRTVRVYQLDTRWEDSSQPYSVVCELAQGDHPIDTVIYVPAATAADGAGHVILGSSMNKQVQLWWLGASAQQAALIQSLSFGGASAKMGSAFAKMAWAEQGRCLTVGATQAPSAVFVLRASDHGPNMRLGVPVGYSLGDEQPVLSLVSALEPQPAGPMLSIYSVHTRLVQQLQIAGIPAVESQNIPDPADIYANPSILTPLLEATESLRAVPAQLSEPAQRREPIQRHAAQAPVLPPPAAAATVAAAAAAPTLNGTSELASRVQESVLAQLQPQITAALGELGRGAAARVDAEAEERLAARISAAVEKRVAASVAAAMEETLIPAYTRATAAMFEQMQATFEAGLREWWMRFAQVPPPHAMGTPLSQM
ncbi:hypothetical protein H4S01_004554, partial [Coemansia sp. RSA 2610]